MPTSSAPAEPSSRLRWFLGWVVLPLTVIAMLFAAGVHVGARRPDKPLARALLWAFGGDAGVRHGTALTGSWRVDDFEFVVDASNLRVNEFSRHLGLVLLLDTNVEYAPAARMTIRAAESKGQPVDRVEWVQRPTKLRGGGWWWRMQSFDESGSLVADDASIAFLDPRADHYLHCRVEVLDPYLDRAEELIDVCKDLEWRIAGPDAPPMEARFGGKYDVSGLELAIPAPPADFEFNTYRPGHEVGFHGVESARPSTFSINSGCFGHCDPATLR
jgi:hypothetical protein